MENIEKFEIINYYPGIIGEIVNLHAVYYYNNYGFDITFETQVAKELSIFLSEFRKGMDGLWVIRINDSFAGSVVIDGKLADSEGARLRWFIVKPEYQGKGIGGALLREALEFCRAKNIKKVLLWTFRGLDIARKLYERAGFKLCVEIEAHRWGQNIIEQKFELSFQ